MTLIAQQPRNKGRPPNGKNIHCLTIRGSRGGTLRIPSFSRHGGARDGAGRKSHHGKTSEFLGLSIYALRKAGALHGSASFTATSESLVVVGHPDRDKIRLTWSQKTLYAFLTRTACGYGGTRFWFECPACGLRVAVLYFESSTHGCRHCLSLRYPTQSEDWTARGWRRENCVRAKLGPMGFRRPKGMHRRTHLRLVDALFALEEQRDAALEQLSFRY